MKKSNKGNTKKKRMLIVASATAICLMMLATFAWDVFKASKENKFGNALTSGSVQIEELFPDTQLTDDKVGLQKEVWAVNSSASDIVLRLSFEESFRKLILDGGVASKKYVDPGVAGAVNIDNMPTDAAFKDTAMPFIVDATLYGNVLAAATVNTDPFAGWADITNQMTPALPTGVKAFARASKNYQETENYYDLTIDYFAYQKVAIDKAHLGEESAKQVIKYPGDPNSVAMLVLAGTELAPTWNVDYNPANGVITGYKPTNLNYVYYEGMNKPNLVNWSGEDVHLGITPAGAATPNDFSTFKPINPAFALVTGGVESKQTVKSTADTDSNINLLFTDQLTTDTPTDGKWFYNQDDGFFYYVGKLASGKTTGTLLSGISLRDPNNLAARVGPAYDYLDYSLWVDVDAVLAKKEAVIEQFFPTVPAPGSQSDKIYQKLVTGL